MTATSRSAAEIRRDLARIQKHVSSLPPRPIRVRVTKALLDQLKAQVATYARPPIPDHAATLFGLPITVDPKLPEQPGFELDYDPDLPQPGTQA